MLFVMDLPLLITTAFHATCLLHHALVPIIASKSKPLPPDADELAAYIRDLWPRYFTNWNLVSYTCTVGG